MLSSWDDYPVHQIAEPIRHVATSDRNFYDRYYFNMHSCSDELFVVMGMGMYPNLGTHDAFITVRRGDTHHVVRANKPLVDRMDTSVGPFRIEILEPLRSLRLVCDAPDLDLSCDLVWNGVFEPWIEPRHYSRKHGRVVFDTSRFAQNGRWSGSLRVGDETFEVTPDRWWGARDRSWGVRPVGEPEPAGIQTEPVMTGMWNYVPMQFDDHSILVLIQEEGNGRRVMDEAVRIWHDPAGSLQAREPDWLGSAHVSHTLKPGTRLVETPSTFHLPDAPDGPIEIVCTPLVHNYLGIGTGYGLGDEYRHGMWIGDETTVEGKSWPMDELEEWAWWAIVEHCARFEYTTPSGSVHAGHGMFEHMFIGPYPQGGLSEGTSVAP